MSVSRPIEVHDGEDERRLLAKVECADGQSVLRIINLHQVNPMHVKPTVICHSIPTRQYPVNGEQIQVQRNQVEQIGKNERDLIQGRTR